MATMISSLDNNNNNDLPLPYLVVPFSVLRLCVPAFWSLLHCPCSVAFASVVIIALLPDSVSKGVGVSLSYHGPPNVEMKMSIGMVVEGESSILGLVTNRRKMVSSISCASQESDGKTKSWQSRKLRSRRWSTWRPWVCFAWGSPRRWKDSLITWPPQL